MGNAITGKQYQDYKNKLYQVRIYSKENPFKLLEHTSIPIGLIDAYEKANPYLLQGEHVLIIPHEIFLLSYIHDATIAESYAQLRTLVQWITEKDANGEITIVLDREKAKYLFTKGYILIDAYTGKSHEINQEFMAELI